MKLYTYIYIKKKYIVEMTQTKLNAVNNIVLEAFLV